MKHHKKGGGRSSPGPAEKKAVTEVVGSGLRASRERIHANVTGARLKLYAFGENLHGDATTSHIRSTAKGHNNDDEWNRVNGEKGARGPIVSRGRGRARPEVTFEDAQGGSGAYGRRSIELEDVRT